MFLNVCKTNILYILRAHISRNNVKCSKFYFYMKANTLADFQICISVPLTICAARCARFIIYFNLNSCTKLKWFIWYFSMKFSIFYLTFNCFWAILYWPFLYFCNFISSFIASKFTLCFFNFLNYSFWSSFKCISGRFFSMIKKILAVCSLSLSFHLCFYKYFSPIFLINTKNP